MRTSPPYGFLILFGMFWAAASLVLYSQAKEEAARMERVAKWPIQPVTIVRSEMVELRHRGDPGRSHREEFTYYPRITYAYEVDGTQYTAETAKPFYSRNRGYDYAKALVHQFPVGAKAQAHVNPDNPADSELQGTQRREQSRKSVTMAGCSILFGLAFSTVAIIKRLLK